MAFVTRDGARIFWRSDGDASLPALLLGNSVGTDHALWTSIMPVLQRHFRVLRWDARGHGASEAPPGDYTLAMLGGDALAVADAAGARRFSYMGISLGGMIGMWVGGHAADRVDRLALCNTSANVPSSVWADRIARVRAGGMASIVDAVLQRWYTPEYLARADRDFAAARAALLAVDAAGYIGCCAAIRDMDLVRELQAIRAPTLVTTGSLDLATPPAMGASIAAAVTGARLVELPVAHIPLPEAAETFSHTVVPFLAPAPRGD